MEGFRIHKLYWIGLLDLAAKTAMGLDCYDCTYLTYTITGFGEYRSILETALEPLKTGERSCLTGLETGDTTCSSGSTCYMFSTTYEITSPGFGSVTLRDAFRGCTDKTSTAECETFVHAEFDHALDPYTEQFESLAGVTVHIEDPHVSCCTPHLCNNDDLTNVQATNSATPKPTTTGATQKPTTTGATQKLTTTGATQKPKTNGATHKPTLGVTQKPTPPSGVKSTAGSKSSTPADNVGIKAMADVTMFGVISLAVMLMRELM